MFAPFQSATHAGNDGHLCSGARKGYRRAGIKLLMNNVWGEFARVRREVLVGNDAGLRFWKSIGFEDYCVTMELQMGDDPRQEQ